MTGYTHLLQKLRWPIVLLFGAASLCSWRVVKQVPYDFSLGPLLEASEAQRSSVKDFTRSLPPVPGNVIVTVSWDQPLGKAELARVAEWHRGIAELQDVFTVRSLANIPVVESMGGIPVPMQLAELAENEPLIDVVQRHPLLPGRLISLDGKSAAILIHMQTKRGGLRRLEAHLGEAIDRPYRVIGTPFVERDLRDHMKRDMARSIAMEALVFLLLMFYYFRSLRGCVIPTLVLLVAVSLHLGLVYALDWKISLLGTAIPGLIAIIAVSDAVHLLHNFEEQIALGKLKVEAVRLMLRDIGPACFYTSLTTAIGFLSLATSDHAGVRDFAYSASLGIGLAFTTIIVLLPTLLLLWPRCAQRPFPVMKLPQVHYGRSALTAAIFAGIFVVAIIGTKRIQVDSFVLEELDQSSRTVKDFRFYESAFFGLLNLELHLIGDLRSPEAFRAVEALEAKIVGQDDVNGAESYTQWIREVVSRQGAISDAEIAAGIGLLGAAGDAFPAHMTNADFSQGRMRFFLRGAGTQRFLALREEIEAEVANFPEGLTAKVTGYAEMAHESTRLVVVTMLKSLCITLGVITLLLSLMYRSWRIGLMALIPNSLPILVALGVTGWLGINLRIGIVMIYSVGIGLAVDDSIHVLSRYRAEKLRSPQLPSRDHLLQTLNTTGTALIVTSIILSIGALCYLPATLQSMRDVGLLLTTIVLSALAADLFLLPLLIERAERCRRASGERPRSTGPR
jgi:predicted RND superfamily exporter protein